MCIRDRVSTTNQTADFNSSAGSQVSMVTKRGTNTWHGTVYEYYLDNNWSANTFDNNAAGVPVPSYHYSRFGAAGGGPLISKKILGGKTYFFANYEGYRFPNSETVSRAVPTASMRAGLLFFGGTYYNINPTAVTFNGVTSVSYTHLDVYKRQYRDCAPVGLSDGGEGQSVGRSFHFVQLFAGFGGRSSHPGQSHYGRSTEEVPLTGRRQVRDRCRRGDLRCAGSHLPVTPQVREHEQRRFANDC